MSKTPKALIPDAATLAEFQHIDTGLPVRLVEIAAREAEREYRYAMLALVCGALIALAVIGGFIYLVMQGHGAYAGGLLGAGVLTMIGGFLRARLSPSGDHQPDIGAAPAA